MDDRVALVDERLPRVPDDEAATRAFIELTRAPTESWMVAIVAPFSTMSPRPTCNDAMPLRRARTHPLDRLSMAGGTGSNSSSVMSS
nr:hypothetical protein [uncultured bacterium]